MIDRKTLLTLCLAMAVVGHASSQDVTPTDSISGEVNSKKVKNRNVMLNASDASKPREVNIGLPSTVGGTEIFEDGLPVSYYAWPHMPYTSWRGGCAYEGTSLMSLSESALLSGNVGYTLNTLTRLGTDRPGVHFAYTLNHFASQKFDLSAGGRIAKGWLFSLHSFQNFDRGSNYQTFAKYQDRTQIYKAALTHRWNEGRGVASFFFKHAGSVAISDNNGPFYYESDGSVQLLPGFDLGHDSYLPGDGVYQFMDIYSGTLHEKSMYDGNNNRTNEAGLLVNYHFKNDARLMLSLKYGHSNTRRLGQSLAGLSYAEAGQGYSSTDGTPYEGYVQVRNAQHQRGDVTDVLGTMEYLMRAGRHGLRFGLNQWYNKVEFYSMTSNWAHTVEADPQHLLYEGQMYWDYNTGAEYYNGAENKLAVYVSDDWQALPRLNLSYGLRLESYHIDGHSPMNATADETNNDRTAGFYLNRTGVTQTSFRYNWLNPIATFSAHYAMLRHFGLTGDYLFNRQHARLENFAGKDYANLSPVDVHLGRVGIYYNNAWLKLVSTMSYIRKTNFKSRVLFTANINGVDESQVSAINYDIATIGWTTDAVLNPFKGFQLHYLITFQKPQYKKFDTTLTFSDNVSRSFSFSDKLVTGVSKVLMEIDPSYTIDRWRLWLSFRFFSKQYINKPNTLSFKSRWETFGGVDYQLSDHISFSANVINFLNQKGASGSITASDLVTDASAYRHYLMSGSFIRPFTAELSVKINL